MKNNGIKEIDETKYLNKIRKKYKQAKHFYEGTQYEDDLERQHTDWENRYTASDIDDILKKYVSRAYVPHTTIFRDVFEGKFNGGNKMREVKIQKVDNGFIVTVGCMTLVSKTWKEVSTELEKYFANPKEIEKKYLKLYKATKVDGLYSV